VRGRRRWAANGLFTFLLKLASQPLARYAAQIGPEERSRRPMTRRVVLLLVVVAALLAFALLEPGMLVRVGM
jgi:hypothetical protein